MLSAKMAIYCAIGFEARPAAGHLSTRAIQPGKAEVVSKPKSLSERKHVCFGFARTRRENLRCVEHRECPLRAQGRGEGPQNGHTNAEHAPRDERRSVRGVRSWSA
jgi:hypothetical protein